MVENLIFGFKMGEIQVQNFVTFLIWDMGKIFEDWYLPTYTYKQIKKSTPIFLLARGKSKVVLFDSTQ